MLDWLIIGGGVHGTYIAHVLLRAAGVPPDRLGVLDPHDRPLARFAELAEAVGFRHLRSTSVHHLDLDPFSLRTFVTRRGLRDRDAYAPPYDRPAWPCFVAHTNEVLSRLPIGRVWRRGTAVRLAVIPGGYAVDTTGGPLEARRVVLAIGGTGTPYRPPWALGEASRVRHVFDPPAADRGSDESLIVVGGGISAVQVACREAESGRRVTLVRRHPLRVHAFDSDPAWMGAKAMDGFRAEQSYTVRRAQISAARRRGSLPADERRRLLRLVRGSWLADVEGCPEKVQVEADGAVMWLEDGRRLLAAQVLLATGFDRQRPGGALVDEAIAAMGLAVAPCGYPMVSPSLEWRSGLFVTGPLAELELGPTARNIVGARSAGRRMLEAARPRGCLLPEQ